MKTSILACAAAAIAALRLRGPRELILPASVRRQVYTEDNGLQTFDQATADSTGVFLVGELEKLDPTLNMPLASVTWQRDIGVRSDVSIADDTASYTNSFFAAAGGPSPNGKSWIGRDTTAIADIQLDIKKTAQPLTLWGMELGWSVIELEASAKVQRPIDTTKFDGMQLKFQMDTDEMVYIGDSLLGYTGMLNSAAVTPVAAVHGNWISTPATPKQILEDVNTMLNAAYRAAGFAVCPDQLRLPPTQYMYLASTPVSDLATMSILTYLEQNSICNKFNGKPLNIQPLKWLENRGAGGVQRMFCYSRDQKFTRYPMVPMQRTAPQYQGLFQRSTYYCRLGVVEVRYEETFGYTDGI